MRSDWPAARSDFYEKTLSIVNANSFCCLAIGPDDVSRHKEWMDTAQDVKDDLKDALDAKLAPKAVEDAAKLAGIGKQEEALWKKAGQQDATLWHRRIAPQPSRPRPLPRRATSTRRFRRMAISRQHAEPATIFTPRNAWPRNDRKTYLPPVCGPVSPGPPSPGVPP